MSADICLFSNLNSKWEVELRGFAPIGMLECWNYGIMGFERMGQWIIDISHLKMKGLNEIIPSISTPLKTGSSTFHYSTIPLFHVRGEISGLDKYL